jgi:DNA-binding MarR family transcriptional regulator
LGLAPAATKRLASAASKSSDFMPNKIVRNRSIDKSASDAADFAAYVAALHRAVHALALYFDRALEGEITQAEAVVLLHLATTGTSTINDVHRAFLHKRSTLTSVVDRLEAKGLVERRIGHTDRRNFTLELTGSGRKAADRVVKCVSRLERAIGSTPAQIRSSQRILDVTAATAAVVYADAGVRD